MSKADDLVTAITQAATRDEAFKIICAVKSLAVLRATADLLHINEGAYLGAGALRHAIIDEARA